VKSHILSMDARAEVWTTVWAVVAKQAVHKLFAYICHSRWNLGPASIRHLEKELVWAIGFEPTPCNRLIAPSCTATLRTKTQRCAHAV